MADLMLLPSLLRFSDCNIQHSDVSLSYFVHELDLAKQPYHERLTAALLILMDLLHDEGKPTQTVDDTVIDYFIHQIDLKLSDVVDQIRCQHAFQQLESLWKSLAFTLERIPDNPLIQIELLCTSQAECLQDFKQHLNIKESALYHHVYQCEYDTPGGEPFAAMVSPFTFTPDADDIDLLNYFATVAELAHCPFIGNIDHNFFGQDCIEDVMMIKDIRRHLQKSEYTHWNAFRESSNARFIGLCFPKFLLKPSPANDDYFYYHESTELPHLSWGYASYALASNLGKSFHQYGWCVNIRGPETGGKIDNLPIARLSEPDGLCYQHPVQFLISESTEVMLSNAGIIPLTYYKNSNTACFFSANSLHLAKRYDDPEVTANHRINARLPYLFLISRIAHYLKVMQRERIGSQKNANELANELNAWLKTLITKMHHPSPELLSTHPLRDGYVEVTELTAAPGYYQVQLYAQPHFQVEGIDVTLNLTAQLPGKQKE